MRLTATSPNSLGTFGSGSIFSSPAIGAVIHRSAHPKRVSRWGFSDVL